MTSSNYDDNEKKVTGGRNGYGAKLANIFSTVRTCRRPLSLSLSLSPRTLRASFGSLCCPRSHHHRVHSRVCALQKFTVETCDRASGKKFKQTWTNNMGSTTKPTISKAKEGEEYTIVRFYPDLARYAIVVSECE